jgi:predicted transcriptional regulator
MVEEVSEVGRLLARRAGLFDELAREPASKPELVDRLGVSRSTVNRALRELETHSLVERRDGTYELTPYGVAAYEEYRQFVERLTSLFETRAVIQSLPDATFVSPSFLINATVYEPSQPAPYEPLDRCLEDVATSEHVRMVTTVAVARYADLFEEGFLTTSTSAEVAMPASVVSDLVSERPAWFLQALNSPDVALRELETVPPVTVALLVTDGVEQGAMAVFENDTVRGYVVNESPDAVTWVKSFLGEYWERATPIPGPQS